MQWVIRRIRAGLGYSGRRRALPLWMRRGLLVLTLLAIVAAYFATVAHVSRSGWVDAQARALDAWVDRQIADAGFRVASITDAGPRPDAPASQCGGAAVGARRVG